MFGFAVNGLLVFTSIANIIYGHKVSYLFRIAGGFLGISILMIVLPLVTNALNPDNGFTADICILVVFGILGGMVQSSTYGLAGMLPGKYMGAVMFGNGISGLALNAIRAICLAAFPSDKAHPDNEFYGSLVYFIIAAVILVFCAIGMVIFQKLEYAQYYIRKATQEKMRTHRRISGVRDGQEDEQLLVVNLNKTKESSTVSALEITKQQSRQTKPKISPLLAFFIMMKNSFLVAWPFLTGLTCVFFITFVVFPGTICDTNLQFLMGVDENVRTAWRFLIFIVVFNLMDTVGRWLGG